MASMAQHIADKPMMIYTIVGSQLMPKDNASTKFQLNKPTNPQLKPPITVSQKHRCFMNTSLFVDNTNKRKVLDRENQAI